MLKYEKIVLITAISIILSSVYSTVCAGDIYTPNSIVDVSYKLGNNRSLHELNLMLPLYSNNDHHGILNTIVKNDSKENVELNLGLIYRDNFYDRIILGVYHYIDYKLINNSYSFYALTFGVETLTNFIDTRANIYLPLTNRKRIKSRPPEIHIVGTDIYGVSGPDQYEYALKGYDLEIGMPLFMFSNYLNNKIGTKIYITRYQFNHPQTRTMIGGRLRLEQNLGQILLGNSNLKSAVNVEFQRDNIRKHQYSIGISTKIEFGGLNKTRNKRSAQPSGLSLRIMDKTVRDFDIVTIKSDDKSQERSPFYHDGKQIMNIVYVTNRKGIKGTGTKNNPLSLEYLKSLESNGINSNNSMFIIEGEGQDGEVDEKFLSLNNKGDKTKVIELTSMRGLRFGIHSNKSGIKIVSHDKIPIIHNYDSGVNTGIGTIDLLTIPLSKKITQELLVPVTPKQSNLNPLPTVVHRQLEPGDKTTVLITNNLIKETLKSVTHKHPDLDKVSVVETKNDSINYKQESANKPIKTILTRFTDVENLMVLSSNSK